MSLTEKEEEERDAMILCLEIARYVFGAMPSWDGKSVVHDVYPDTFSWRVENDVLTVTLGGHEWSTPVFFSAGTNEISEYGLKGVGVVITASEETLDIYIIYDAFSISYSTNLLFDQKSQSMEVYHQVEALDYVDGRYVALFDSLDDFIRDTLPVFGVLNRSTVI